MSNNSNKEEEQYVWNFAYGSNMNFNTLYKRLKPFGEDKPALASHPAVATDWVLTFDTLGNPFSEPSYCNIRPWKGKVCHGVVHKITLRQWECLTKTEGGGGVKGLGYQPGKVTVKTYGGETVEALAFVEAPSSNFSDFPSKRYLDIVKQGATENKLEDNYLEFLTTVPHFTPGKLANLFNLILGFTIFLPFFVGPLRFNNRFLDWDWLTKLVWIVLMKVIKPIIQTVRGLTGELVVKMPVFIVQDKKFNQYWLTEKEYKATIAA
jgi:cation transport regulator ChaC